MVIDSSTIIGGNGDRRPMDFYPTPPEVTHALIDFLEMNKLIVPGQTIWECACGDGAMVNVFHDRGYNTYATDIQNGIDFLTADFNDSNWFCAWIITNPPFNQSADFIAHAAELGRPFAFLLKSQYWHAARRIELWNEHTPSFVLPITWRPDFT